MDRHVAENSARALNIVRWWRAGITRNDSDHLHITNFASVNDILERHEVWVKTTVETYHHRGTGFVDDLEAGVHPLHVKVNWFFTKDRLTGSGELLDQIGMRIGRGTDDYRIDVFRGQDLLDTAHLAIILMCQVTCRHRYGISHRNQLGGRV